MAILGLNGDRLVYVKRILIVLAILLFFLFILFFSLTIQTTKGIDKDIRKLSKDIKRLYADLKSDLGPNHTLPLLANLYWIQANLSEPKRRLDDLEVKENDLEDKIQKRKDAQDARFGLIKRDVGLLEENLAEINRNFNVLKTQADLNQQSFFSETKKSVVSFKEQIRNYSERAPKWLIFPKKERLSFEVGWNLNELTVLQNGDLVVKIDNSELYMWDTKNGTLKKHIKKLPMKIMWMGALNNGNIVSFYHGFFLNFWDRNWQLHKNVSSSHKLTSSIAAFKNGNFAIATVSRNQSEFIYGISIWSQDGALLKTFDAHTSDVRSMVVLPNDDLVSTDYDGTIKMWRPDGTLKKVVADTPNERHSLAVDKGSAPGFLSVSSGQFVYTWDINGELKDKHLLSHPYDHFFGVLPNGFLVFTRGYGEIVFYDRMSAEVDSVLRAYMLPIIKVIILPNGELVSSSDDGIIKIWKLEF